MKRIGWIAAGLHVVGTAWAAAIMRPGTNAFGVDERMAYLAASPTGWRVGWAIWMAAALSLVALIVVVVEKLGPRVRNAALVLVGAALAIDFLCDVMQLTLPELHEPRLFVAIERVAGLGGTVAANGLYTLTIAVVTTALPGRVVRVTGIALVIAGTAMVAAGLLDDARILEPAVGATVLSLCAWAIAVAR